MSLCFSKDITKLFKRSPPKFEHICIQIIDRVAPMTLQEYLLINMKSISKYKASQTVTKIFSGVKTNGKLTNFIIIKDKKQT